MKQFTINIGLHNNPLAVKETNEELIKQGNEYSNIQPHIYACLHLAFGKVLDNCKIAKGEWDGASEPTFVAIIETDDTTNVYLKVEQLCMIMAQICIPYSNKIESHLVYNPFVDYTDDQKYDFNSEFFINL